MEACRHCSKLVQFPISNVSLAGPCRLLYSSKLTFAECALVNIVHSWCRWRLCGHSRAPRTATAIKSKAGNANQLFAVQTSCLPNAARNLVSSKGFMLLSNLKRTLHTDLTADYTGLFLQTDLASDRGCNLQWPLAVAFWTCWITSCLKVHKIKYNLGKK